MKKLIFAVIFLLAAVLFISCGSPGVVKQIGGFDVDEDLYSFLSEDDGAVASFFAPYALAEDLGYDLTSDEFKSMCDAAREQMLYADYGGDEDKLKADIEEAGMTEEVYGKVIEQDTLKNILYLMLIDDGTIESDSASLREEFASGDAVCVKRILLKADTPDAEEILSDAYEKAVSGKRTFDELKGDLVAYFASGEGIGNYGDYYIVLRGNTDNAYEDACFSLAENEISQPFETEAGHCMVKRYPLTDEILDATLDDLVKSYGEGQFNIMLEEKAEEMLK